MDAKIQLLGQDGISRDQVRQFANQLNGTVGMAAFQRRIAGINGQRIAWSSRDIARIAAHFGVDARASLLPDAAPQQRRAPALAIKDATPDGFTAHFVASDGSVDRMGDVINPSGWRLGAFRKNGVVLFAHDSGSLPVGRATSIGVENGKLMVGVKFADTGLGRAVASQVRKGFLNAVSVGFVPIEYSFATEPGRQGGIDFKSTELLEVSIVPVPANANALLTGMSDSQQNAAAKAAARRKREIELIHLRTPPLSQREQRMVDLAKFRAR